jgi:hypothetical protein
MKFRTFTSLDGLPPAYQNLFRNGGSECFYSSLPWFRNIVRNALNLGDEICVYGVESDTPPGIPSVALAARYNKQAASRFKPLRLSGLSNYYSSSFGPLLNTGERLDVILEALGQGICSDRLNWDMVELRPLDVQSPVFPALVKAFQSAGMVVQTYFCFGNWYCQVGGLSYQQYLENLPSALKNTLRRKGKKLEKSRNVQIEIITGPEGLEDAIRAYQKVYDASWKVPEPYPMFTPGLIRTCAEEGWLRLGLVFVDHEPIAAQLWVVNGGHATIFKLAHDEKFAELSAGSILTARMMKHVIEVDKVQEVDFGSGDDPYKRNWLPNRRERWGILALNPRTLPGILGIARHVTGRAVKNALRSVLGSSGNGPQIAAAPETKAPGESR